MRTFKGGEEEYHFEVMIHNLDIKTAKIDIKKMEIERARKALNVQMINDFKAVHACRQVIREMEHEYLDSLELRVSMYVVGEIY